MPIKDTIENLGRSVHHEWDKIADRLNWGVDKPVVVANYSGFGRANHLFLTGRVLRDKAIGRTERDGLLQNVINNFKRFNSREIPGAEVEIKWAGEIFHRTTDAEGYFKVSADFDRNLVFPESTGIWQQAEITVLSTPDNGPVDHHTYADVLLPQGGEFGIISDIDDTVLQTDVTSRFKLKTMWHTILKNAGNRRAFEQVADFYQALHRGADNEGENPIFYLSNSPWNLYDLLTDFLSINQLPKGPVLLRDFGLPYEDKPEEYQGHKTEMLRQILRTYPEMKFILLGDSGEHDTDIYLAAAREFPEQIQQIYIRDVQHERRAQRIEALIENNSDIPVKLIGSYVDATAHGREKGYVV
ncbi:hypothetical protein CEQ90_05160 [Lewinellaceae bacterium SD302]|nr:hypothetical protein CEQ90_05160 [Lewinellaceae bacterium SD302]